MTDLNFQISYGLMSPYRYFGVPEFYGKEYKGGNINQLCYKFRIYNNIEQADNHTE